MPLDTQIGQHIYRMLSMGLDVTATVRFVADACSEHKVSDLPARSHHRGRPTPLTPATRQLSEEQTSTLVKLASNLYMTAHLNDGDFATFGAS